MPNYTDAQLQQLWVRAGGSPTYAPVASAIARAESGGNPNATNHNTNGTTDRGLWQINSIHGSLSTYDPLANARAAVAISQGGKNWHPWCTAYSNGNCTGVFMGPGSPVLRYLKAGTNTGAPTNTGGTQTPAGPAGNAVLTDAGGAIGSITNNPVLGGIISLFQQFGGSVANSLNPFTQWQTFLLAMAKEFAYVLIVAAGFIIMIIGLIFLVLSTGVTRAAIGLGGRAGEAYVGGRFFGKG